MRRTPKRITSAEQRGKRKKSQLMGNEHLFIVFKTKKRNARTSPPFWRPLRKAILYNKETSLDIALIYEPSVLRKQLQLIL